MDDACARSRFHPRLWVNLTRFLTKPHRSRRRWLFTGPSPSCTRRTLGSTCLRPPASHPNLLTFSSSPGILATRGQHGPLSRRPYNSPAVRASFSSARALPSLALPCPFLTVPPQVRTHVTPCWPAGRKRFPHQPPGPRLRLSNGHALVPHPVPNLTFLPVGSGILANRTSFANSAAAALLPLCVPAYSLPPPRARPYIPCLLARAYSQTVRASTAHRRRHRSHCSTSCTLLPRPASNRTHLASCPGSPLTSWELYQLSTGSTSAHCGPPLNLFPTQCPTLHPLPVCPGVLADRASFASSAPATPIPLLALVYPRPPARVQPHTFCQLSWESSWELHQLSSGSTAATVAPHLLSSPTSCPAFHPLPVGPGILEDRASFASSESAAPPPLLSPAYPLLLPRVQAHTCCDFR